MKVVWVTPKSDLPPGSNGWSSKIASVRYRAIIPARELSARGHQARVLGLDRVSFDSIRDQISTADKVVFRKNYFEPECAERMLQEMRARGVKTLFDLSDDRLDEWHGSHLQRMIDQVDTVVTASPLLQQIVRQHASKDSFVIGDPFEGPQGEAQGPAPGPRLKALWFGHPTNLESLYQALPVLLEAGKRKPIDLCILTERVDGIERACKDSNSKNRHALSLRFAEWSLAQTWKSLAETDFVIIPSVPDNRRLLAKSTNRMVESLWAGRFVVAHPVPSYMEFKDWAWIGEDLAEGIAWMAEYGSLLVDRVQAAQHYIDSTYSPRRIASDWEKVLEKDIPGCGKQTIPGPALTRQHGFRIIPDRE